MPEILGNAAPPPQWQEKLSFSWSHEQNIKYKRKEKGFNPPVQHLDEIAKGLFKTVKENSNKTMVFTNENWKIISRVNYLANRQMDHYKSSKFGFVEKFFSSFRNLFSVGKFQSSAYLAKKMSEKVIHEWDETGASDIKYQGVIPPIPKDEPDNVEGEENSIPQDQDNVEFKQKETIPQEQKKIEPETEEIEEAEELTPAQRIEYVNTLEEVFWNSFLKDAAYEKNVDPNNPSKYIVTLKRPMEGKLDLNEFVDFPKITPDSFRNVNFEIGEKLEYTIKQEGEKKEILFSREKTSLRAPFGTWLRKITFEPERILFEVGGIGFFTEQGVKAIYKHKGMEYKGYFPGDIQPTLEALGKIEWKAK